MRIWALLFITFSLSLSYSAGEKTAPACGEDIYYINPTLLSEYNDNAAGHGGMLKDKERGILYKPVTDQDHEWFVNEYVKREYPLLYQEFMPMVYGMTKVKSHKVSLGFTEREFNDNYMIMQDVTYNYTRPQMMDIKVGVSVNNTTETFYYITGYTGKRLKKPEKYENSTDYKNMNRFMHRIPKAERSSFFKTLVEQLTYLQYLLKEIKILFRNVSILIVYDGEGDPKPRVWLIDLARTVSIEDQEVPRIVVGVGNIIRMLTLVQQTHQSVYLVRHGERHDYQDFTWTEKSDYPHDPPLSPAGREQAREIGAELKKRNINFDCIVSSPFYRAVETAEIIRRYLPSTRLYLDYGYAEFMSDNSRKSIPTLDPYYIVDIDQQNKSYGQIYSKLELERWKSLKTRTYTSLLNTLSQCTNMVIVSHRSTFQGLVDEVLGREEKELIEYGAFTVFDYTLDKFTLLEHNNKTHLKTFVKSPQSNPNYARQAYKDINYEKVKYEESGHMTRI